MKIKTTTEIAKKWAEVTPARSEEYKKGVETTPIKWNEATIAAEANYNAGIDAARTNKSWSKGVSKAGDETWRKATSEKGTARWGSGVRIAEPNYNEGFNPYRETLAGLTLPPKYPKGDPRNIDRVATIAKALNAKKKAK